MGQGWVCGGQSNPRLDVLLTKKKRAAGGNRTLVIITEKKFAYFAHFSSELLCTDPK